MNMNAFSLDGLRIVQHASGDAIHINAVRGVTVTCRTERWYEDMALDSPTVCKRDLCRNKPVKLPWKMVVVVNERFRLNGISTLLLGCPPSHW